MATVAPTLPPIDPSLRHVCEAKGQEGWAQPAPSLTRRPGPGTGAEEAGLVGTDHAPPSAAAAGTAWHPA